MSSAMDPVLSMRRAREVGLKRLSESMISSVVSDSVSSEYNSSQELPLLRPTDPPPCSRRAPKCASASAQISRFRFLSLQCMRACLHALAFRSTSTRLMLDFMLAAVCFICSRALSAWFISPLRPCRPDIASILHGSACLPICVIFGLTLSACLARINSLKCANSSVELVAVARVL